MKENLGNATRLLRKYEIVGIIKYENKRGIGINCKYETTLLDSLQSFATALCSWCLKFYCETSPISNGPSECRKAKFKLSNSYVEDWLTKVPVEAVKQ